MRRLDMALPGAGHTWSRLLQLAGMASQDLSLGRIAEGHADALAILAEAGREPAPGACYGVWAARDRADPVRARPAEGGWELEGRLPFCSGAPILDRALVVAGTDSGSLLFDIPIDRRKGIVTEEGSWPAAGMAASQSLTLRLHSVQASDDLVVGPPGFYTTRPGFWWGAVGVAACWWGGASALVEHTRTVLDDHVPSEGEAGDLGRAAARLVAGRETLRRAAACIDAGPDTDASRRIALVTREVVHTACTEILGLVASAGGARGICLDGDQSRRVADLYAYLAQHHGGRDAAALGASVISDGVP